MKVFLHAYYWLLDYLYVAKVQIANLFARDNPLPYAKAGAPPVLLIPGVYETWRFMNPLAEVLHANGYDVHVVEAFKYNTGSVDDMAAVALQYVQSEKLHNVTIVTHSKGGLIGKRLLMMTTGSNVFNSLVAINAPFSGSFYAYLLPLKSLRLFAPSSKVIKSLAEDVASNKRIVSIYGLFDPHIPGGSKLNGAQNVQLPTYGHFRVLADARVHTAVLNAVEQSKTETQ